MQQADNTKRSREYSAAALERMESLEIPPTPENYTVWYAYSAGQNPDLNKALDVLISNKSPFTAERNLEIYERFFAMDADLEYIQETGRKLEEEMGRIVSVLGEAGKDTNAYGRKMADLSGALSDGKTLENVQTTVRAMLQETRAIMAKNQHLEHRLEKSTREVTSLRADLESVRRDAVTDSLTGIANRKLFDQRLREAGAAAMEHGHEVSVVLADIDHFKQFNDRFGHHVGDEVLKLVAAHLRNHTKGRDTSARYGGEEFALILPETALGDAITLIDRIRDKLASHTLTSRKSDMRYGKVTISAGVARYRLGESLETLLERADTALYAAKGAGRNRVLSENDLDPDITRSFLQREAVPLR
jgi:diguanylate cyclase